MQKGIGSHQSAAMKKEEWLTPPEIITALAPFDLDPCSCERPPWTIAPKTFTKEDNGLSEKWDGFVWCNPPYGTQTGKWLDQMAIHNNGIALVFARTETEMFQRFVWARASCLLFIFGRLYFYHSDGTKAKGNAGAPSVLVGYGDESYKRLRDCDIRGRFVSLS